MKKSRKMLMIEKNFQRKIISRLMLLSLVGVFIMSSIIYLLANESTERTFFSIHQGIRATWEALLPAIFLGGGITLIFTTITVFYVTLYQSHKIGGPIYRFRKVIEALNDGHLNVGVKLREGDYLSELGSSLERTLAGTRNRISDLKQEVRSLQENIERTISHCTSREFPDGELENLKKVRERSKKINDMLDFFTVD